MVLRENLILERQQSIRLPATTLPNGHRMGATLQGRRALFYACPARSDSDCKLQFLNEPVPDVPFPWVNDKADFTRFMAKQVMHGLMRWCGIIVALAIAVAAILFW